ncbi:MAG: SPOR domain-containing protein [Flavobacteriales bacterium]
MRIILLLSIVTTSINCTAQDNENKWRLYKPNEERNTDVKTDTSKQGVLLIHKSPQLDTLISSIKNVKESEVKIEGFTVQIAIFQKSADVNRLQAEFLKRHPEVPTKIDYKQPNFRLRVGRFYDRLSAESFLSEIANQYPGALVIKDQIELPVLPEKKPIENPE